MMKYLVLIFVILMAMPVSSYADDIRYCGIANIERDKSGDIKRSKKAYWEFRSLYPCPSTGQHKGACPGWSVDHVLPLASGGCDSLENLQWLPNVIKSGKKETCSKDRWEREVYKPGWDGVIDWEGCNK